MQCDLKTISSFCITFSFIFEETFHLKYDESLTNMFLLKETNAFHDSLIISFNQQQQQQQQQQSFTEWNDKQVFLHKRLFSKK